MLQRASERMMAKRDLNQRFDADRAPGEEPATISATGEIGQNYHYWRGATGRRYLHTVFPLLDCPEIPKSNYIIVARGPKGARRALEIGQTFDHAGSLNLAYLRQRAAQLGGCEIHIHVLSETPSGRNSVEADLRARHGGQATDYAEIAKAS